MLGLLIALLACSGPDPVPGTDTGLVVDSPPITAPDFDMDADGWTRLGGDCDDNDPAVNPDAEEVCDGVDNDCDGDIDGDASEGIPIWMDADGDGWGQGPELSACTVPSGYAGQTGDCDDGDRRAYPGADEYCDGIDNDCDDVIDEDEAVDAMVWYRDADMDGCGDELELALACWMPEGYVSENSDTDDGDPEEGGEMLWCPDLDGDGWGSNQWASQPCVDACSPPGFTYVLGAGDCNDNDPEIWDC